MGQICFILIGREHFTTGAPRENPLLSLKCGALSYWSRAVSPPGGATGQLSTVLIGREPSRDL